MQPFACKCTDQNEQQQWQVYSKLILQIHHIHMHSRVTIRHRYRGIFPNVRMQSLRFAVRSSVLFLWWKQLRTMPPKRPKLKVGARSSRTKTYTITIPLLVCRLRRRGVLSLRRVVARSRVATSLNHLQRRLVIRCLEPIP